MCFWCLLFCATLSFCYCLSGDLKGVVLWINEFNKHFDCIFNFKILNCLMKCRLPGSVISWSFQTVKDMHNRCPWTSCANIQHFLFNLSWSSPEIYIWSPPALLGLALICYYYVSFSWEYIPSLSVVFSFYQFISCLYICFSKDDVYHKVWFRWVFWRHTKGRSASCIIHIQVWQSNNNPSQ